MDSVGVGAAPDAESFGDEGAATLQHIAENASLAIPTLLGLGLGNILRNHPKLPPAAAPTAFFGKMVEASPAKDTSTGHWEMMGVIRQQPPKVYPQGFPADFVTALSKETGRQFLGNKAASGTEIIAELGAEHMQTGCPILYTSADSVLQIAAHVDIIPLEELYRICRIARKLARDDWEVDRVIARPFVGSSESGFTRTEDRRDFSIPPPRNYLDLMSESGVPVTLVGKLEDVFAGRGFSASFHTHSNQQTATAVTELLVSFEEGMVFANFIDFDMLYGHRNDTAGYAGALEEFDRWLGEILGNWSVGDLLILTADHGNDPTYPGTDHTRECVPLLVFHRAHIGRGFVHNLGVRQSFADLGATVVENFGLEPSLRGRSFLADIRPDLGIGEK